MAKRAKKKDALPQDHADFAGKDADPAQIAELGEAAAAADKRGKRGHNKGPLSEETAKMHISLIQEARTNWRALRDEATKGSGVLRNRIKIAKGDGLDTTALLKALDEADRPAGAVITEHRNMTRYLTLMGSPLGTQLSLLEDATADGDDRPTNSSAMDAELQGQHAWSNGEPVANVPFTPGSEEFAQWVAGWNAAQHNAVVKMGESASH